jgi:hypothetical protein
MSFKALLPTLGITSSKPTQSQALQTNHHPTAKKKPTHTINMFRQQIARQARLFSTTPVARKSPVETIKDAAKAVDRTISGAAVKGIEKGGTYKTFTPLYPVYISISHTQASHYTT